MSEETNIQKQSPVQKAEWKRWFSDYQWIVKNIPFFFFLATLAVLYIYNGHYAEKLERNISAAEKNIKEQEYEYKTIQSEVIFRSKASELEELEQKVAGLSGLKELTKPPIKLEEDSTDTGTPANSQP